MPRTFHFALLLCLIGSTSLAQHDAMVEMYGEGVHRYFCNDFTGADQILSQVVDGGSQDPRAHYFRGLARERAGYGGEMDFENGARLEAEGKRVVDVGSALARIQGSLRTKIEKARRDARIQVKQQQLMMEQTRQLMEQAAASATGSTAPNAAGTSPFPSESIPANDTGLAPLQPAQPTQPEVSDTSDPFKDESAPAMPDATAPATPAPAAPDPAAPAPAAPGDPFAPPAGATDPFAPAPADGAAPAAGSDPFAT